MVRYAWPGWWLGLLMGAGSPLLAQAGQAQAGQAQAGQAQAGQAQADRSQADRSAPRVELKENYPNPFFPATTIPFEIFARACEGTRTPVVSLKVYNVLVQVVAIPVLDAGPDTRGASGRPGQLGARLDSLPLGCGRYRAYWDGSYLDGARQVTPGIYYYQLTVDGERFTRKMIAQRRVTSRQ